MKSEEAAAAALLFPYNFPNWAPRPLGKEEIVAVIIGAEHLNPHFPPDFIGAIPDLEGNGQQCQAGK